MKLNLTIARINQLLVIALVIGLGFSFMSVSPGGAASEIEVNSFIDESKNDGQCTLREAIIAANTNKASGKKPGECISSGAYDRIFLPAGTYTLTKSDSGSEDSGSTGDLDIREDLTITGAGASTTTIKTVSGFSDRIFHILNGNAQPSVVHISGVSLQSGNVKDDGGAIHNAGNLTLSGVDLSGSTAEEHGGAIYNLGSLELINSTVASNQAGIAGGGVYNLGTALLVNATISGNGLTITKNTLIGGGGYMNAGGASTFTNVTFAGNGANAPADSGGSLRVESGSAELLNTLVAEPAAGGNCYGAINSDGYNLSDDDSCGLSAEGDLDNEPYAGIGSLKDNGGETLTHALFLDSPAIDSGINLSYPETDQRGVARPFGEYFDIGAYESRLSGNISWTNAQEITPGDTPLEVYIDSYGVSRWFKFEVHPGQQVVVTLTDLPGNYDLTLYKDIAQAYVDIVTPADLTRLDAEFAPDAFSPDAFSPDAFSPDAFSPDAFSPDAFSPDAFSPDAFSPDAFSPDAFSPDAFSPDAFSPDAFSPDAFSPDAFSPDAFSPDAFSPDAFSPDAFSSAQTRSLIAVSAFEGTASEGVRVYTWDNDGYFYIRVRGRNGISVEDGFALMTLKLQGEQCENVSEGNLDPSNTIPITNPDLANYRTIILWDSTRLLNQEERLLDPLELADQSEILGFETELNQFAALPTVNGLVVDVSLDDRVDSAKQQVYDNIGCPYAVNLWAEAIEDIVDAYWDIYPLEYVVLVGNDDAIPFFREPDHAMLANEKNYVPPVRDATTSQASLKLGYVLSQDRYGSEFELSLKESEIPIPALAVGRLVETTTEIIGMLEAYGRTNNGVVNTPTSTLVTGYDFLTDSAYAIAAELESGAGFAPTYLISERDAAPSESWNADQLRANLLSQRHDLVYLAGHFSANSALAADYVTRMLTTDLVDSEVDLENSIIFSAGCHSGYNIVDLHDIPGVTRAPDWAQAFAQKGATLIAGTGYQYGDTDFIEYSERLYLEFSRQLLVGSGPVPIGKALAEAKAEYLASTPVLRGIHEKAFLEATLFGLPMLSIDMPQGRLPVDPDPSEISTTNGFGTDPGAELGLRYADLTKTVTLIETLVTLTNPSNGSTEIATYLEGSDGVVSNPVEPVLPLESYNVSVPGYQARGVGFRGGSYADLPDIIPLTGSATTEVRGVHTPFLTDIFFPVRFWNLNYFDSLSSSQSGQTHLNVTPAQFHSDSIDLERGTLRQYDNLQFRLYYSNNTTTYGDGSIPALSGPPTIANITSLINGDQVDFQVTVLGNPAAGIQEAWITYTSAATGSPFYGLWQSLDLQQDSNNTLLWKGSLFLDPTEDPDDIRFMVQAVNGVGMVSAATNLGLAYIPGVDPAFREPTTLTLDVSQDSAAYGTKPTFSASLVHNSQDGPVKLEGMRVLFRLGAQTRLAITDAEGVANVQFPILGLPDDPDNLNDDYELKASFPGTAIYAPATDSQSFSITKQYTSITLDPTIYAGPAGQQVYLTATLTDITGRRLGEKTLFFVIDGPDGEYYQEAVITDYAGRAYLGELPLTAGLYNVSVFFSGGIDFNGDGFSDITLVDDRYFPSQYEDGQLLINNPPVCDNAYSSLSNLWPPNGDLYLLQILGITDPEGDPVTISIDAIFQDEPVGKEPDAVIYGDTAELRAERDGNGDGRVYHIYFTATDSWGNTCSDEIVLGVVDHDQSDDVGAIDGGALYDSTIPD
jgi:CSLREA domain-containing protein